MFSDIFYSYDFHDVFEFATLVFAIGSIFSSLLILFVDVDYDFALIKKRK